MEVVLERQVISVRGSRASGFSLLEVLIASLLFLVVALGILPMFQRAIRTNAAGQDSTDVANLARSRVEEYMQVPFDSLLLNVIGGTENQLQDHYLKETEVWAPHAGPHGVNLADPAIWERTTTVRWYNVASVNGDDGGTADPGDDLQTGIVNRTEALSAGTPVGDIHFKEIEVTLQGVSDGSGIISPGKRIVVRALRSQ